MNQTTLETEDKGFIQLNQVHKSFESAAGRFDALMNINLNLRGGEYVAIVGKSGSGKSTLLNMLTGIDHPSEGTVTINSTNVHSMNESQLAKWRGKHIGIVFQFFQLIPTLTILENLILAMEFVGTIARCNQQKRAERLLEQVGIAKHRNKFPQALSGGEQQRASIARALANDPPIIVADEPTGNLDSKTTSDLQKLLVQLVENGKTVIVVTHEDISNQEYERVITIGDGLIISDQKTNSYLKRS